MLPGSLVRIKPEYEGYGCQGVCYIVSRSSDAVPMTDIDTYAQSTDYITYKTFKVYVPSIERIMTFFEYELDIIT